MTWDRTPDTPAAPVQAGSPPPLFGALHWAVQHQWRGVIAFEAEDGSRGMIHVGDGRVMGLDCDSLSPARLMDLLRRSGILDDRQVERLARRARKTGMDPVAMALETGMVSRGTLAAIREAVARETMLALMLERGLRARQVPEERPGPAVRDLSLPIPFLLKEAHRRHQEAHAIRQVVTGEDQIFVRTGTGMGSSLLRWEELPMSPAERQVFFFVDGRRSVGDLALATCQSVHEVSRALASLHAAGLVRALSPQEAARRRKGGADKAAGRLSLWRMAAMTLALGLAIVSLREASVQTPTILHGGDTFHQLMRQASSLRVQAAGCLFRMQEGRPPRDFDELLEHHLVVPGDRKADMMRDVMQEAP